MSYKLPKLMLEPEGRNFRLVRIDERGERTEMVLSEDDVLTLAQSAQLLQDRILARHTKAGQLNPPAVVVPVSQAEVNADAHWTQIHLTFHQSNGSQSACFGLSRGVAQSLVDGLPKWIAQLDKPEMKH